MHREFLLLLPNKWALHGNSSVSQEGSRLTLNSLLYYKIDKKRAKGKIIIDRREAGKKENIRKMFR